MQCEIKTHHQPICFPAPMRSSIHSPARTVDGPDTVLGAKPASKCHRHQACAQYMWVGRRTPHLHDLDMAGKVHEGKASMKGGLEQGRIRGRWGQGRFS